MCTLKHLSRSTQSHVCSTLPRAIFITWIYKYVILNTNSESVHFIINLLRKLAVVNAKREKLQSTVNHIHNR